MNPEPFTYLRLYHDETERTYRKNALVREARMARASADGDPDGGSTQDALRRGLGWSVLNAFRVVASALASQRQTGV
jgi:hypothetical protein